MSPLPASSRMYLRKIAETYTGALEDWQRAQKSDETPEFWSLPLEIGVDLLKGGAAELIADVNTGKVHADRKAKCIFLFCLLKTRLSNARANRFWPAVNEGIGDLAGDNPSPGELAKHFRKCLEQEYRNQLRHIEHAFKFVYLCFAESGAGADRTHLIKQFFHRLVDRYHGGLTVNDRVEFCDRLLTEHIASNTDQKAGIQSLSGLMQRSGYELLALADELRARSDLITVRQWGWQKLCKFWREHADVELERLLPEAQEVFLEMLPAIAGTVTRLEFQKLIRSGQLIAVQPDAAGKPSADELSTICVGPAQIKYPAGETNETYVRDNTGLNCLQIMGNPEEAWAKEANRYLIWRKCQFEVLSSAWRQEPAVPMFAEGRFSRVAKPIGWFWSSERDPENLPVDCKSGMKPRVEAEIRVSHHWWLREGRLTFAVNSFSLLHTRELQNCQLRVARTNIWSGDVSDQSWIKVDKEFELEDPRQDIDVCLHSDERIVTSRVFRNPIVSGAALFLGCLCRPEVFVDQSEVERIWLLSDEFAGIPKAKGFEVLRREISALSAVGVSAYQFRLSSEIPDIRWISLGYRKWKVRIGPFATLVPSIPDPKNFDGVRFVPTGATHVVTRDSNFCLTLDVPSKWNGVVSGKNELIVKSASRQLTVSLGEILPADDPAGRTELNLMHLLDERRFEPAFGLMDISLEGPDISPFVRIRTFFLNGQVSISPCALGEYSSLTIHNRGRTQFSITAMHRTGFDTRRGEFSKARALISLAEDEQLWLAWQPLVKDIAILAGENPIETDRIELFDHNESIHLIRFGNVPANYMLCLDEKAVHPFTEERIDIRELFAEWRRHQRHDRSFYALTVIDSETSEEIREWIIDFAPKLEIVGARWDDSLGEAKVIVDYELAALSGQKIRFDIINGSGERDATKTIEFDETSEKIVDITFPGVLYEDEFVLVASAFGAELARLQLPRPPEFSQPDSNVLRDGIAKIAKQWQTDMSHAMQLLHLYDRYISTAGFAPWPAGKISRQISHNGISRIEELAGRCLLYLEYFAAGKEVDFDTGRPSGNTKLELFLATMALGDQLRLYEKGLMIPALVDQLREAFESAAEQRVKKYWSESMIFVCNDICPQRQIQSDSSVRGAVESALKRPFVMSDEILLEKLRNLREGRDK